MKSIDKRLADIDKRIGKNNLEPSVVIIELNTNNKDNGYKYEVIETYMLGKNNSKRKELYFNDYQTEYLDKVNYKNTTTIIGILLDEDDEPVNIAQ
jgi:hypothetical protein